jgi:hypothetical protein
MEKTEFEIQFEKGSIEYLKENGITIDFEVGDKIRLKKDLELLTGKIIKKEEILTVKKIVIDDIEPCYRLRLEEYGVGISPQYYAIEKIEEE